MKILSVLLLCATALAPAAFAAETATSLPAGMPAGVKQAQVESSTAPWLWIGLGAAAIAIIAVSSNGGGNKSTVTTTGTGG